MMGAVTRSVALLPLLAATGAAGPIRGPVPAAGERCTFGSGVFRFGLFDDCR
jgi:hypothetical protein